MTATRSEIESASSWSWVMYIVAMPEAALDPPDLEPKRQPDRRVERRQRLVEQQYRRLDGERPGEGDALLLATRQLVRIAVRRVADLDQLDELGHLALDVRLGALADIKAVGDVLGGGHVREQRVRLEDDAHAPPVGRLAW